MLSRCLLILFHVNSPSSLVEASGVEPIDELHTKIGRQVRITFKPMFSSNEVTQLLHFNFIIDDLLTRVIIQLHLISLL